MKIIDRFIVLYIVKALLHFAIYDSREIGILEGNFKDLKLKIQKEQRSFGIKRIFKLEEIAEVHRFREHNLSGKKIVALT